MTTSKTADKIASTHALFAIPSIAGKAYQEGRSERRGWREDVESAASTV